MKKMRYISLAVAVIMVVNTAGSLRVFGAENSGGDGSGSLSAEESSESESEVEKKEGTGMDGGGSLSAEESSDEIGGGGEELGGDSSEGQGANDSAGVIGNIVIKSFNPGYTNQGEFFELSKLTDKSILLAGLTVFYTTSSGKEYEVYKFPEGSEMVGESLLMRLASSDEVKEAEDAREVADGIYTRNMAQGKGKIELRYATEDGAAGAGDEEENGTFEMLCWGYEDTRCFSGFSSSKPTTLVRNNEAEEMEDLYKHVQDYQPEYNPEQPGLIFHEVEEEKVEPKCRSLEFSEIFTYFENSAEEQFVEIFNRSEETTEVTGCVLKYKNKNYELSGTVGANGFLTIYPFSEFGLSLTKNPTSANSLEIIDIDGERVDSLSYFSGQRKGVSLAMFGWTEDGKEIWRQTYSLTPGAENVFQEYKLCPVGKVINLETGNCVNETTLAPTVAACPEGKYRNPLTGRCKSYATTASAELKPCAEGYERNPETGRCRKIVKNDGAEYPVEVKEVAGKREFVAIWAIVIIIIAGVLYILFQYREEIRRVARK